MSNDILSVLAAVSAMMGWMFVKCYDNNTLTYGLFDFPITSKVSIAIYFIKFLSYTLLFRMIGIKHSKNFGSS